MDFPSEDNHYQSSHAFLLANSYRSLLGKELIRGGYTEQTFAKLLFDAPIAIMSHDTSPDPVFNYANLKALELFEMSWDEFTRMPSRLSAESSKQEEREKLLAEVRAKGFIEHFQSMRTSKNGKRFYVWDGAVWNLIDTEGCYRGQAACLFEWEFL